MATDVSKPKGRLAFWAVTTRVEQDRTLLFGYEFCGSLSGPLDAQVNVGPTDLLLLRGTGERLVIRNAVAGAVHTSQGGYCLGVRASSLVGKGSLGPSLVTDDLETIVARKGDVSFEPVAEVGDALGRMRVNELIMFGVGWFGVLSRKGLLPWRRRWHGLAFAAPGAAPISGPGQVFSDPACTRALGTVTWADEGSTE